MNSLSMVVGESDVQGKYRTLYIDFLFVWRWDDAKIDEKNNENPSGFKFK